MARIISLRLTIFIIGFLLLFALRLGYGYVSLPNGVEVQQYQPRFGADLGFALSRNNYAGQKSGLAGTPSAAAVDQRYEKVASLGVASDDFDRDEDTLRGIATDAGALIQHEQLFGLTGGRQLQLALGVAPAQFDSVIMQLRDIGRLESFQVNKIDKTNEYRQLLAQQASLVKSLENLVALKSRDAELSDFMALEAQILSLENQIQSLGVSVGEFDSEFEFVTIKLAMREVPAPAVRFISFLSRAKVAVEWAVPVYLGLCFTFFLFAAGLWVLSAALRIFRQNQP